MRRVYAFVALIVAFASLSGVALAKKPAVKKNLPVVPGSQYLALGDSVTFGYEEAQVTPEEKEHLTQYVGRAQLFLTNLRQRRETIRRIAEYLIMR